MMEQANTMKHNQEALQAFADSTKRDIATLFSDYKQLHDRVETFMKAFPDLVSFVSQALA